MKNSFTCHLTKQNGIRLLCLVLFLSFISLSCSSKSPQKTELTPQEIALGTWSKDANCRFGAATNKIVIESNGEALYLVTFYEPEVSGYPPQRTVNGIFRSVAGRFGIEFTEPRREFRGFIEILPEAKKLLYQECFYTKQ